MPDSATHADYKPREIRRNVLLTARMRAGASWSDACILNISTRGLMVHAESSLPRGSYVEVRKGPHVIVWRVMWSEDRKLGLATQDDLSVDNIIDPAASAALQLAAAAYPAAERRARSRSHETSRQRGRAFEFVCVAVLAASLSTAAFAMVQQTLARPLAEVRSALATR